MIGPTGIVRAMTDPNSISHSDGPLDETLLPTADAPRAPPPVMRGRAHSGILDEVPENAICAEIGTWKGDFAAQILAVTKPKELNLIDPWKFAEEFPGRWYGGKEAHDQADMDAICAGVIARFEHNPEVIIHRQPSASAHALFQDYYFDWIYIDGDHSYEAVAADLAGWLPKVRAGGMIICDDYYWRDENGKLSVKAAVDEFVTAHATRGFKSIDMGAGQIIITVPASHGGADEGHRNASIRRRRGRRK
jgi:hypothetical protein